MLWLRLRLISLVLLLQLGGSVYAAGPCLLSESISAGLHDEGLRQAIGELGRDKQRLLPYLATAEARASLSEWLQKELVGGVERPKEALDQIARDVSVDTIAIGAGIHNVIALSTLALQGGRPDLLRRIVLVDAGDKLASTFFGKKFRINSPELGDATANDLPGAVFQLRDFMPEERSAEANDLALTILLNLAYLKSQGLQIVAGTPVERTLTAYPSTEPGFRIFGETYRFRQAIIATGLGDVSLANFRQAEHLDYIEAQTALWREKLELRRGVVKYHDLARAINISLERVGPESTAAIFANWQIAVVGAHHSGFISAEPFVGRLPTNAGRSLPRTASKITMFGLKAKTKAEFLDAVRPGGSDQYNQLFSERYERYGLADAIGNFVEPIPHYATDIAPGQGGQSQVYYRDAEGKVQSRSVDLVIVATGQEAAWRPLFPEATGYPIALGGKMNIRPVEQDGVEIGLRPFLGSGNSYGGDGNPLRMLIFGAGSGVEFSREQLEMTITGSPDSINALGPRSAAVGAMLRQWMLE